MLSFPWRLTKALGALGLLLGSCLFWGGSSSAVNQLALPLPPPAPGGMVPIIIGQAPTGPSLVTVPVMDFVDTFYERLDLH